ncbi:MAG: M50 family metallopeptidase [Actinomycetia bacterium]|nr:M50 family metallopeptidase [Actinomycetes bacterium]
MDQVQPLLHDLWLRVRPGDPVRLTGGPLLVVLAVAAAVVGVPALWRVLRVGVTLVHELGHAMVGLLVGRRFTGFVLRADMSGHAVTSGPVRGLGRGLTTWAGYPAPALVGAALAWLSGQGWAAPATTLALLVLLVALVRVRSVLTAVVTVAATAGVGALWWWRVDQLQAPVLLGVGCVLVVGAWRHLGAVARRPTASSDPGVLAQLTRVPAVLWNLSFAVVCALATWLVGLQVWTGLALP